MSSSYQRPVSTGQEGRRTARYEMKFRASLREQGTSKFDVTILDLSVTGFRFKCSFNLRDGTRVWLTIPGLSALESEVVWHDGYSYGCAFTSPLYPAVLDHIAKQAARSS